MKRFGSIAIALLICLFLAAFLLGVMSVPEAQAAASTTWPSHTFTLTINPDWGITTPDNVYFVVYDIDTGYTADGDTGTLASDTVWNGDGMAIEAAHVGTNLDTVAGTIPALPKRRSDGSPVRYAIKGYENATPANTDELKIPAIRYDPEHRITFTDTVPIDSASRARVVNQL